MRILVDGKLYLVVTEGQLLALHARLRPVLRVAA